MSTLQEPFWKDFLRRHGFDVHPRYCAASAKTADKEARRLKKQGETVKVIGWCVFTKKRTRRQR